MQATSSTRARGWPAVLAFFLLVFLLHLWLELRAPGMHGVDGYYHIKLARLYLTGEVPFFGSTFPWMTHSLWTEHRCDWQAGYHLLLIPFTAFGLLLGGKLSAALFASLIPTTVFVILRAERARWPWFFAGLLAVASEYYLVRVHLPRPTSPVVALLLGAAYFASKQRLGAFFGTTTAALVVYCVPHNAGAVTAVAALVLLVLRRRLPVALCLAGLAALCVGVLTNPGFWHWRGSFFGPEHALFEVWEQMGGSLQAARDGDRVRIDDRWVSLQAPAEFQPPEAADLVAGFELPVLALALGLALLLAFGRRRGAPVAPALTAWLLAALYFALFLRHVRFAEYWIPFACLAAGLATGLAWPRPESAEAAPRSAPRWLAPALLALGLVLVPWRGARALGRAVDTLTNETGVGLEYEAPMAWIAANTEPDSVIFHARWPQFCPMFFFDHRNRYLIGLDPYFFFQVDPLAYESWIEISEGRLAPEETLAGIAAFDARHALVKRDTPLDLQLRRSRALPVYEDGRFRVYDVAPEPR